MIERKIIIDKVVELANNKVLEFASNSPFSFIIKPYMARLINNYIGKLDNLLKPIEDKDGKIDIEGILSESMDNLIIAQAKKYNILDGIEIGNGTIKISIPSFSKDLVFDTSDIELLKENLMK